MANAPVSPSSFPKPLRNPAPQAAFGLEEELWFGDDSPEVAEAHAAKTKAAASATVAGLLPLPEVAQQVMRLLSDPDVRVRSIKEALEKDPSLASRILRVANSAAYRPVNAISDIEQAVVRLGSNSVKEILGGVAALGVFKDVGGYGALFRTHCAGVAAIARVLGTEWRYGGISELFLTGLMHDVGKLLSIQAGEIDYASMDPASVESPDGVHGRERELLGYDHAVLGSVIIEKWRLSQAIADVVGLHHQPGRAYANGGNTGLQVAILRIADRIDYQLRASLEEDDFFFEQLSYDGACSYAQFDPMVLRAMWPKLVAAHQESKNLLI